MKKTKAQRFMRLAPVDWEKAVDKLMIEERDEIRRELEGIAERAAMLAGYLDERHGYGCGDQGHSKAVKTANHHGKMVWMKTFGYNGFHPLTI